jgi:hypothetical protein
MAMPKPWIALGKTMSDNQAIADLLVLISVMPSTSLAGTTTARIAQAAFPETMAVIFTWLTMRATEAISEGLTGVSSGC